MLHSITAFNSFSDCSVFVYNFIYCRKKKKRWRLIKDLLLSALDVTHLHVVRDEGRLGDHRQEDDSDSVWEVGTFSLIYIISVPCSSTALRLCEVKYMKAYGSAFLSQRLDLTHTKHLNDILRCYNMNCGKKLLFLALKIFPFASRVIKNVSFILINT